MKLKSSTKMAVFLYVLAGFLLAVFVVYPYMTQGQAASYNITERTEYGITENTAYITITDLTGKDQYINVSSVFTDDPLTRQITQKDMLMLQDYEADIYGLVNVSYGKYKTKINNCTAHNETNITCETLYYDDSDSLMECDYVLADKSCLKAESTVIGTETRQKYTQIPGLKQKTVIEGKKIEQKSEGIPLPKNSVVHLKYAYRHPLAYNLEVPASVNKYNITVEGTEGDYGDLDPTWWDSNWDKRNCFDVNTSVATWNIVPRINITHDSDMQACGEDIRFTNGTDADAVEIYAYNKTSVCGVNYLVYINLTATGNENGQSTNHTYCMYYDNSGASAGFDGSKTFTFFEDFESYSVGDDLNDKTKWTGDAAHFYVSGYDAYSGTKSAHYGIDDKSLYNNPAWSNHHAGVIGAKMRANGTHAALNPIYVFNSAPLLVGGMGAGDYSGANSVTAIESGWSKIDDWVDDTWHDWEMRWDNTSAQVLCHDEDCEHEANYAARSGPPVKFAMHTMGGAGTMRIQFDNFFAANNTDQTVDVTWLGEETAPAAFSATATSPTARTYKSDDVWFNLTCSPNPEQVFAEMNGTNYTLTNSSGNWNLHNTSMTDGQFKVFFHYGGSAATNDSTSNITFTVNNTPSITVQSPGTDTLRNETVYFNITADEKLDWAAVEISGTNYTMFNSTTQMRTNRTLDDAEYDVQFWFNDTEGNMNTASFTFVLTASGWWNTSFLKRKPLTLAHNSRSGDVNVQVKVNISINDSVMFSDCRDCRIVSSCFSDGELLDAWNETQADGNDVMVWFNVSNYTVDNEFCLYYNCSTATAYWDANATFVFYDDFEDYTLNDRLNDNGGWMNATGYDEYWTVNNTLTVRSGQAASADWEDDGTYHNITKDGASIEIGTFTVWRAEEGSRMDFGTNTFEHDDIYTHSSINSDAQWAGVDDNSLAYYPDGGPWTALYPPLNNNSVVKVNITWHNDTWSTICAENATNLNCTTYNNYDGRTGYPNAIYLITGQEASVDHLSFVDDVFVANMTHPQPNITIGAEEDYGGDTCDTCAIDCTEGCVVDEALDCDGSTLALSGRGVISVRAGIIDYNGVEISGSCGVECSRGFCII